MDELVFGLEWSPMLVEDMGIDRMAYWMGRYQARQRRK